MNKVCNIANSFRLKGRLTKIHTQKSKIKYIKLATEQGKYWLKIPKKLRTSISRLSPGCQLEVVGRSKKHPKTDKVKYKAQTVIVIPPKQEPETTPAIKTKTVSLLPVLNTEVKSKAQVLICQKSNCWKNGGKEVCQQLETSLSDRGLTKKILIKKTGCLKKCKQAPNIVMMPDKARYSKVKPKQVENLVEKHLIGD
ncbi:MAG: (2Fe-2S) ferredoxin domain-containing protein [Waterburya sp.]